MGGTPIVTGVVLIFEAVIIWPLRSRFEGVANVVAEPLWDQSVSSRDASCGEELSGDSWTGLSAPLHPVGMHSVSGVMWVSLTLRVVLQTCLGVVVLLSHPSVKGWFLLALIFEHALEHSQLLFATILLLFNLDFKDPMRRLVKREKSSCRAAHVGGLGRSAGASCEHQTRGTVSVHQAHRVLVQTSAGLR